ncbi:MAG: VWA domain-containing protein [Gammaproteobacteria bacterium]|nr:VWA domain-containing protein [Gammaproteobacteria bacterium]
MELHFLRPYWFLAIIPMLILCWQLSKVSLVDNWRSICDEHLLAHLLVKPKHNLKLPIVLLIAASMLTIIALAGPSWQKQTQPIYQAMVGRILVLNLSPSMADTTGSIKKIDRARFKMLDFLNKQKEGLTGLVVYTDEAHTISPLTDDAHTVANFVPSLDPSIMPTFNDDTTVGLKQAGKLFKQAGLNNGSIVLITDKITHYGAAKNIASTLYAEGYRLYILDLSQKSVVDPQMQKLAAAGGGKVIYLTPNNRDVENILAKTSVNSLITPTKKTKEKGYFWQDNGRLIVFFILPFALLAFRKGYL